MKKLFASLAALTILAAPVFGQEKYKGLPVIKATEKVADYKIGQEWTKGSWHIMPEYEPDVLQVPVHASTEKVTFYTNLDSISYEIKPGEKQQFYVQLNEKDYALTELQGFGFELARFDYAKPKAPSAYKFTYEANHNNAYLKQLREQYKLDAVVAGAANDTEKALKILNWVHNQWKHNGENEPRKSDALSILEEVKEGKNFRCVEYGIVATSALNSLGLPARTMGLKIKDVETIESGAGHVLLEVYLPDLKKWAMLDGQVDAMPVLYGRPLNAVEFQNAIVNAYDELEIRSLSGTSKAAYVNWVYPYLYYFDVRFDNREGTDIERKTIDGKASLMLMPIGAKQPTVFQRKHKMDRYLFTNSVADFYQAPVLNEAVAAARKAK